MSDRNAEIRTMKSSDPGAIETSQAQTLEIITMLQQGAAIGDPMAAPMIKLIADFTEWASITRANLALLTMFAVGPQDRRPGDADKAEELRDQLVEHLDGWRERFTELAATIRRAQTVAWMEDQ